MKLTWFGALVIAGVIFCMLAMADHTLEAVIAAGLVIHFYSAALDRAARERERP